MILVHVVQERNINIVAEDNLRLSEKRSTKFILDNYKK